MNDTFTFTNGCDSVEDFMKRIKTKPNKHGLVQIPIQETNGFYLELNGFPQKGLPILVTLCHEDYNEKVIVFVIDDTEEFLKEKIETVASDVISHFLCNYTWVISEYVKNFFFSKIRESLKDIAQCVKKGTYKNTPLELKPFQYWIEDSGNVIMAIPECLLKKAETNGNLCNYEVGIPCSYVLEKGYRFHKGHVIVDAPYDSEFGLDLPDSYDCW